MTEEEIREVLSAGRECYSALVYAAEIFERDKKRRVPKVIKQTLERNKPILYGAHLAGDCSK